MARCLVLYPVELRRANGRFVAPVRTLGADRIQRDERCQSGPRIEPYELSAEFRECAGIAHCSFPQADLNRSLFSASSTTLFEILFPTSRMMSCMAPCGTDSAGPYTDLSHH